MNSGKEFGIIKPALVTAYIILMKESKVMKKRMSRILSILLVSVLVVSAGNVVQAEDAEEAVTEVQAVDETEEPEAAEPEAVVEPMEEAEAKEPEAESKEEEKADKEEAKEEDKSVEVPAEKTEETAEPEEIPEIGSDAVASMEGEVIESIPMAEMSKSIEEQKVQGSYQSQAIDLPAKGTIILTGTYTNGNYWFGLFKDEALDSPVDGTTSVSASYPSVTRAFKVPQAGRYYVGAYVYNTGNAVINTDVRYAFYDGSDRTLSNAQPIAVGQKDSQTNYFKFKAVSTGYLVVEGDENAVYSAYCKVALCKSPQAAYSGETSLRYAPAYGVKKGKTYYIKVTATYNSKGNYTLKVTNKKISDKMGKKKSKAVTLKRKKTKKGMIQAGAGSKDATNWYKLKLTKKRKVTIDVTSNSNDAFKISIYKGGRRIGTKTVYNRASGPIYSIGKWPKGTYYVKVQRKNTKSSGWYTLKWR